MAAAVAQERSSPGGGAVYTESSKLAIGDTLTVVSGCLGGAWVVEDENGVVYLATAVE